MTKNPQDPAETTANTKTSQKKSSPSRKLQAALSGRRTRGSINPRNIRGKSFQSGYEIPF